MSAQPNEFLESFSADTGEALVEVIRSTYRLATECFELAKPYSDSNTFGTELYRFAGRMLTELSEAQPDLIETAQVHPAFVHRIGRYDLFCHRVAKRIGADIWRSFPNPETESVERSTSLYLPGYEPDLDKVSTAVLAHIGNEATGLYSVHLCWPVRAGDGQMAWGYVHELYVAPVEGMEPQHEPSPPAAPAEDVSPAVVRRRTRKTGDR